MKKDAIEAIQSGLKGAFIHSNPLDIIEGLSPELAMKKVEGFNHSIWDLLHHTVIWQDIFISNIKGQEISWDPKHNWPAMDDYKNEKNFDDLLSRFRSGIEETNTLLEEKKLDFTRKQRLSSEADFELSTIKLFMTILQHLSYHIGQMAVIRKIVDNNWPKRE